MFYCNGIFIKTHRAYVCKLVVLCIYLMSPFLRYTLKHCPRMTYAQDFLGKSEGEWLL